MRLRSRISSSIIRLTIEIEVIFKIFIRVNSMAFGVIHTLHGVGWENEY
jgi:hypothetical protein